MANKHKYTYVAGIMDGEGHISIARSGSQRKDRVVSPIRMAASIGVTNTDLRLMNWLKANFGGNYYSAGKPQPRCKPRFKWFLTGGKKKQEHFLLAILPYLLLKKEQAKIVLEFLRLEGRAPDARMTLVDRVQALNKRGEIVETNTPNTESTVMIGPELNGNIQSEPAVT